MKVAFELIACWVVFSCVIGTFSTWAFFRGERLARDEAGAANRVASQNLVEVRAR